MEKLKSREKTAQRKEKATWRTAQSTLSSPRLDPSPRPAPLQRAQRTTLCKAPFSSGGCPSQSRPCTWEKPGDLRPGLGPEAPLRHERQKGGPGDPLCHLFLGLKEHFPIVGLEARRALCSGFSGCRVTPGAGPVLPASTGGRWRHVCSAAAGQMLHPLRREQGLHCRLQLCCSQSPPPSGSLLL